MAEAPLSALCSICYTNPPKYRCPRCPGPVRTCSLPCYKRHQQRASCNGQRDPAAYVKKSQLTTPAGIDHDYNFLTKIDNVIAKSDQAQAEQVGHRGHSGRGLHRDSAVARYLKEHRIMVDRAPHGMSRQKANETRWVTKSKRVIWTVEWVDVDGVKRLGEVRATETIGDAYAALLATREKENKKRKRVAEGLPKSMDRATGDDAISAQGETSQEVQSTQTEPIVADSKSECQQRDSSLEDPSGATRAPSLANVASIEPSRSPSPDPHTSPPNDKRALILQRMQEEKDRQAALRSSNVNCPPPKEPHFYLLKPHTTSKSRVLIPLSASETLTSCLSGQVVLEFPTIYVLLRPIDNLPEGFTSEEAYLDAKNKEEIELEDMMRAAPGSRRAMLDGGIFDDREDAGPSSASSSQQQQQQWDERSILEMLKRDVKA